MDKIFWNFLFSLAACVLLSGTAVAQADKNGTPESNPFSAPTHLLAPPQPRPTPSAVMFPESREAQTCYEGGTAKLRAGDHAGALVEFDRLVVLRPRSAVAYFARSLAKERKKDYAGAIADESLAIQFDPDNSGFYFRRGVSKMLSKQWPEASKDLRESCEKLGVKNPYSRVFLWLARHRLDEKVAADQELAAYLDDRTEFDAPTEWVRHIGRFLLGHESEADFLGAASRESSPPALQHDISSLFTRNLAPTAPKIEYMGSGQQCEARFYIGEMRLFAGDKAAAAEQFRQCIATKRAGFVEYELAEEELKTLKP